MFASGFSRFIIFGASFLLSLNLNANLTLDNGSYHNRTVIDQWLRSAHLNFNYYGCDENANASKIKLTPTTTCKKASDFFPKVASQQPLEGNIGEVVATYDGEPKNCPNKFRKKLFTQVPLERLYEEFTNRHCLPTYLVIRDGTNNYNSKHLLNKTLCRLPDTRIMKKGFPTDAYPFFNLKANDNGFKVGDNTQFRFDHTSNQWCVRFRTNAEKCGQWPHPLPLAYKDDADNKFHVKATISLSPNGQASVRAIDKVYATEQAMFQGQRNGDLLKTDTKKGRIDYSTWRKSNGLVRAVARSYETDGPRANHERSINFFARNVFGSSITNFWCATDNCFHGVTAEKLATNKCSATPSVEMTNGASGNVCHSCIGMLPGLCAIEKREIDIMKSYIQESPAFTITEQGEYKAGQDVERGLIDNFNRIVKNPTHPGCHQGSYAEYPDVFDPGEAMHEGASGRSVNIDHGSL